MNDALAADIERFRAESHERLARLRPTDTLKGLFLNRYLALFREQGGERLVAKGRAAIDDRRLFDFFNYPYAFAVQMALAVTDELAPRYGSVDAWLFEVGRLSTESYLKSVVGRVFLGSFRPEPATLLARMPWAISTTLSFGRRTVTFPSATSARFVCRDEFSAAPSNAGAVQAALEAVGARAPRIEVQSEDLFHYTLLINWES